MKSFFSPLRIIAILVALFVLTGAIFFAAPALFPWRAAPDDQQGNQKNPAKVKRGKTVSNPTYQQLIDEGDYAFFAGNLTKAQNAYQKASELEPREYLPYEKMGDLYFLQKNYASARQNFELAQSINPAKDSLNMKIIRSVLGLRKVTDAKAKLEAITPSTQESLYYQGLIAAFLNDQEKAKKFLTDTLTAGANESLKTNAQKILTVYRDYELARDAPVEFLQALMAQAFDHIGEYGLAIELAFDALKTQHDYRDVWVILGHAFLNEQKWADAEDAFSKALQLDAGNPPAYFFRGMAKRRLKKNPEAVKDFEQALKLGVKPQILIKLELADLYFDTQDFARAFPYYKEVVTQDPSDIERFVRPMALAINHLNKPVEAMKLARKAYETHPNAAMASNLLGWAAFATNDLAAARKYLEEALARDPELAATHLNMGQLSERAGKFEEALTSYETALNLAEKSGNASIGNTASLRYNALAEKLASGGTSTPAQGPAENAPNPAAQESPPREVPSLSLL